MNSYIKKIDEFEQQLKNTYGEAQLSRAELLSAEQMIEIALAKIAEKRTVRSRSKDALNVFCEEN